jgi:hypothetical protein
MATVVGATKDIVVANLIDAWKGDSNSISVFDFFESVNEAAEMGRLSSKDKVHLVRLKLRGTAKAFYSSQPSLKADDCTFEELRTAFVNRFKDKHTDQYNYARVQAASQEKNESPEIFLDRLRKLSQQTVRVSANAVEQAVMNQEADRRLLAAFIHGLQWAPGRHLRMQMPENIDKALNMAIVATNAEREEWALSREERGVSAGVFAVGGNRDVMPHNRVQWSHTRGGGFRGVSGRPRRGDGTHSGRTGERTPVNFGKGVWLAGGGSYPGPKGDDDRRTRRPGIQCYKCRLFGHVQRNCPRGQERNLNGIGRTMSTPSSNPK